MVEGQSKLQMDHFFSNWRMSENPRVLLADDSIANRIQIKQILKNLSIQVVEAESGHETITLVSKYEFGAILLDVNMPDINGFETAGAIVKEQYASHTPIIFLTSGELSEDQVIKGYETGAIDFISWSDIPKVLPAKLNFYLNYYTQKKDLESANQTKSEFLSNMSHELRTPLNSILVLAQLLSSNSEQNLTEKQLKFADTIFSSGTDLLNIINEILDLSKVEAGMMQFVIDEIVVSDFIDDIRRKITHTATNKGLDFQVNISSNTPKTVHMDGVRVNQILNNLLSNAIKFTSSGSVKMHIFQPTEPIETTAGTLAPTEVIAFAVKDTGIGVPDDKKNLIFEAFRQADGSIRRKYGGTGLGLSISKKLALIMGGELIFNSQQGQGSTFVLYLPQQPINPTKDSLAPTGQNPIAQFKDPTLKMSSTGETIPPVVSITLKGKKVLLVEDDIVNVYVMLALLDKVGISTEVASNGKIAIERIKSESTSIDLILMDMMMPEMDGFEATRIIKENEAYAHIPIIAVTARAMKGDREKCFDAGVDGYITKPVLGTILFNEIYSCINKSKEQL